MSTAELVVIGLGGVVGYLVVSYVMNQRKPEAPVFAGKAWHQILDVSPVATPEQIEAAYAAKQRELDAAAPSIMTDVEEAADARLRAQLEAAKEEGLASVR